MPKPLLTEDQLPVDQIYWQRQADKDERAWQSLVGGGVSVNTSAQGLEQNAQAAKQMNSTSTREQLPANPPQQSGMIQQGVDKVLRTLTGHGVDEIQKAIDTGTLPELVNTRMASPIANVGEALVTAEGERTGQPSELTSQLAEGARSPIGSSINAAAEQAAQAIGYDPDTARKIAGVAGGIAAILGTPGAMQQMSALTAPEKIAQLKPLLAEAKALLRSEAGSQQFGKVSQAAEAGVNTARVSATSTVKTTMEKINQMQAEKLAPSRVPVPHAETVTASQRYSLQDVLTFNPAEVDQKAMQTALRDHYVAASTLANDAAKRVLAGDASAGNELMDAFAVASDLAVRDEQLGKAFARGLESRKIMSDADRATISMQELANFRETIGTTVGLDPQILAARLTSLSTKAQKTSFMKQAWAGYQNGQNLFHEAWINALVSGPQTHAANVLSNQLMSFWVAGEREMAGFIGRFHSGDKVVPGEGMAELRGIVESWGDLLRWGGKTLEEGKAITGNKGEFVPSWPSDHLPPSPITNALDYAYAVAKLGDVPTRALNLEDAFAKGMNYRMEGKALALREGVAQGKTGQALTDFTKYVETHMGEFPAIKTRAEEAALINTFNEPLGPAGKAFMQLMNNIPAGRVIAPFIRTPSNIATSALERIVPTTGAIAGGVAGAKEGQDIGEMVGGEEGAKVGRYAGAVIGGATGFAALTMAKKSLRDDIIAGGARRDLALAKVTSGALTASTVASLAGAGVITGGGPKDKNLQREMKNTGWQPYSVKIGDTYYSYNRLDPIGMMIGVVADSVEILGQIPEDDALTIGTAVSIAFTKNLTSKTYMQGLSQALEAITKPEEGAHAWAKGFYRSLVPGAVRQLESSIDPTVRETRTLVDNIRAGVPGWSETLPPRRNLYGDPIRLQGGLGPDIISPIYSSSAKDDPVSAEIARNRVSLSMPSKFFAGPPGPVGVQVYDPTRTPGIELTPKEYDRLVVLMGKEIKDGQGLNLHDHLEAMMQTPRYKLASDGPEGGKADMIRLTVNTYKERAQLMLERNAKIGKEFPELYQDLKAHREEMLNKKRPVTDYRSPQFGGSLTR